MIFLFHTLQFPDPMKYSEYHNKPDRKQSKLWACFFHLLLSPGLRSKMKDLVLINLSLIQPQAGDCTGANIKGKGVPLLESSLGMCQTPHLLRNSSMN